MSQIRIERNRNATYYFGKHGLHLGMRHFYDAVIDAGTGRCLAHLRQNMTDFFDLGKNWGDGSIEKTA